MAIPALHGTTGRAGNDVLASFGELASISPAAGAKSIPCEVGPWLRKISHPAQLSRLSYGENLVDRDIGQCLNRPARPGNFEEANLRFTAKAKVDAFVARGEIAS